MPWARFEDRYPFNRKIRPLSDAAFRLDVSGICWSAAQLTDGIIGVADLEAVSSVKRPRTAVKHLVACGRWHDLEAVDNGVCEACAERLRAVDNREPTENRTRTRHQFSVGSSMTSCRSTRRERRYLRNARRRQRGRSSG